MQRASSIEWISVCLSISKLIVAATAITAWKSDIFSLPLKIGNARRV